MPLNLSTLKLNTPTANTGKRKIDVSSFKPVEKKQPSFMSSMATGYKNLTNTLGTEAEDFVKTALLQPVRNLGKLSEQVLNQTVGRGVNLLSGKGFTPTKATPAYDPSNPLSQKIDETLAPKGSGVGSVAGEIAPYLIPVAGEEKLGLKIAEEVGGLLGKKSTSIIPKIAGGIAKSLGKGAVNTAIGTAQTGSPTEGLAIGIGGEVISGSANVLSKAGEALYKSVLPTTEAEAGLLQNYKANKPFMERIFGIAQKPETSADVAFKKGLVGSESMLGVQSKIVTNKLWKNLIEPQLDAYEPKVNIPSFLEDARKEIIKNNPELANQTALLEALDSIKADYKGVTDVTMKDLQNFKSGWAKGVPEKYYKGKDIKGNVALVKATLASMARTKIYNALGSDVKQAYLDYSNLQSIQELGRKAMTGSAKLNLGSAWGAIKDMLITPIATVGGRTIYRTGEGVQLIGGGGAKVVGDLFDENPKSAQE